MTSTWLGVPDDDPFSIDNLPYGRAVLPDESTRLVVRLGHHVVDVSSLGLPPSLDALLASGPSGWARSRAEITALLTDDRHVDAVEPHLYRVEQVTLRLPFHVADYVDFYASRDHAANAGRIFRPGGDPLPPNWTAMPLGYHGRAGSVVVSGTPVTRPHGQFRDGAALVFGRSGRLDFEVEVGFVVGVGGPGPIPVARLGDHVFGVSLLNDWSARDIQAAETVPLGPFLGKSFATSVSAWVTPLAALDAAWCDPPPREDAVAAYLDDRGLRGGLDIALEVAINSHVVSRPQFARMTWTPAQMLAHLTVNGAALRPGDLYASGTVSGPEPGQLGCLLEMTRNGAEPLLLPDGSSRTYLDDGDEVRITATVPGPRGRLALGEVTGRIRTDPIGG
jgi:fumarylacetoacetase